MEKTQNCPYCGEEIAVAAKKCKHCKEWLTEKESIENAGATQQESPQDEDFLWMPVLCYVAMLFTLISCIQDLGFGRSSGSGWFWLAGIIPEWLTNLANGILMFILFWNLGNYFLKRKFQLLAILGGFGSLCALFTLDEDTDVAVALILLSLVGIVAYLTVMFIVGIKIKSEYGWIFLVYSIGSIIFLVLGLVSLDDEGDFPWWATVADGLLDLFLLSILKTQFEAIGKSAKSIKKT